MGENILAKIAADTKIRINKQKEVVSLTELQRRVEAKREDIIPPSFKEALEKTGLSFICEVKKASPSKGVMVEDFRPFEIAKAYEAAGADAFSVLTEPKYFLGSDEYLKEIVSKISIPALRKDFTVDPYMIYEAADMGASAVLLITAILTQKELEDWIKLSHSLGLDALVETHDEEEIHRAVDAGADIIGINNRDLRSFTTTVENSIRLRHLIPKEAVFVSESGIHTEEDIRRLKECGTDAVLIGEAMVTSGDKSGALEKFRNA